MFPSLPALSFLLLGSLAAACAARPTVPEPALGLERVALGPVALELGPMLRPPRPLDDDGIFYVLGGDPPHPRVRYLDGQLSLNETCAIRVENKLSRRVPPAYVNGLPLGFC